jgi:prepilin-type N-terminal cleavage/methylation domain-containing protein
VRTTQQRKGSFLSLNHRAIDAGSRAARRGLTLTELLVVVAIIATLIALLTPTILGARQSAFNAKVKAELDMLHTALMNYKNEYGSFPPADMRGLWNGSEVSTTHAVYRHLVRVFPRIDELATGPNSPYLQLSKLSPAQALVFWLRGFYPNQAYPLTNNGDPGKRKKFYDFDESRLYAADEYAPTTRPQTFSKRSDPQVQTFGRDFPVYFTAHTMSGLPYVYLDSRCYATDNSDIGYRAQSMMSKEESTASPYFTSDPPSNPLWSQRHMVPDTFQVIASGPDGSYGTAPAAFPLAIGFAAGNAQFNFPAAADAVNAKGHADNLTNFASGPLLKATDELKAR